MTHGADTDGLEVLRGHIARIEGRLARRLEQTSRDKPQRDTLLRVHGLVFPASDDRLSTGNSGFDEALGGGLPRSGLVSVIAPRTRDSGAATAFALALCALLDNPAPIFWAALDTALAEGGLPWPPGLESETGLSVNRLLLAAAARFEDLLWMAGEAAALPALAALVVELRGNPQKLDLTVTRRLQHRARSARHPVFLLQQAGQAQATAATIRLIVSSAPAAPRRVLGTPLPGSIGPPAFDITVSKSPTARHARFVLEWMPDDRFFRSRQSPDSQPVVSPSRQRQGLPAAPRPQLAQRRTG